MDKEQLIEKLKKYNHAYRNGNSIVNDSVYDNLIEQLREIDPQNSFLTNVETEKLSGRAEIRHPSPMLSLEKAYTKEQLERFLIRVEKEANQINIENITFKVMPKLDGLAGRDDGKRLVTRGNGLVGFDISDAFNKGVITIGDRGQGLGEIVAVKSYFDEHLSNIFVHPRNMVAGIINSEILNDNVKNILNDQKVQFVPYSQLNSWEGNGKEVLENIDTISETLINETDYPMDGIVVEVVNEKLKQHMGMTSHHYRWQIAVKKKGNTAETIVESIQWQVGRTGNITPVLIVTPTTLSGATIRRVTAHNAGTVKNLKIGPGACIEIIRSGEVIPKIEKVISSSEHVNLPSSCPICKNELAWKNDFLRCSYIDCPAKKAQRIIHWFKTIGNTDWFGAKTVEKLVDNSFDTLEKLYAMEIQDFLTLGFGPTQSNNLFEALNTSQTKSVEDWRFLASFGIPDLGIGDSRKLLQNYSMEDILNIQPESIISIDGFGQITSLSISEGIKQMKETIQHMLNLGFNLERSKTITNQTNESGILSGKHIVFTGKMLSGDRKHMQEQARQLGAIIQSGISGKTDLLVCGQNVGKTKLEKAKNLNVMIISEEDYCKNLIKNNFGD
jgi:DNA ligase (NAD+)